MFFSDWFSDICERDSDGFSDPTDLVNKRCSVGIRKPELSLLLACHGYPFIPFPSQAQSK